MKYVSMITLALFSILAQGCAVDADQLEHENPVPPIEYPNPGDGDEPVNPIEPAPAPEGGDDLDDDPEIVPPIERAPAPEEDNDGGADAEGHGVDGDEGDEDDRLDEDDSGFSGEGEDGEDGEGDEEDGEDREIRGACEPGQDECDPGFACEETCEPSFCDDEGRCTMDCHIVYACIGNDPIPQ